MHTAKEAKLGPKKFRNEKATGGAAAHTLGLFLGLATSDLEGSYDTDPVVTVCSSWYFIEG